MGNPSPKASGTSSSSSEPMQMDTTKFKKLSPAEKKRHIKLDLCLYCGNEEIKEKHRASDCLLNRKNKVYKARSVTGYYEDFEKLGNGDV